MKKHIIFFAVFAIVAILINNLNYNHHFNIKYAYIFGSILFAIPATWFAVTRKDLIPIMLISGLIGIPFGILTQYFFYTKDWWQPQTITDTRIGIEDVIYSFFHGLLLVTTGLVLNKKNILLNKKTLRSMTTGILRLGVFIIFTGLIIVVLLNMPSFILTSIIFLCIGLYILANQPSLIKVGITGICGTLCWCMPVFWITNSLFPSWIQEFWINNTNKILVFDIPLLDLCWYASVGFSGAMLPEFLTRNSET